MVSKWSFYLDWKSSCSQMKTNADVSIQPVGLDVKDVASNTSRREGMTSHQAEGSLMLCRGVFKQEPLYLLLNPLPPTSLSGIRLLTAVSADLDLQRGQIIQPALFHFVAETLLFLFDHGAPHLLQRWVVLLFRWCQHLFFLLLHSVISTPPRLAAWPMLVMSTAAVTISRAKSAPQATCRQEMELQLRMKVICSFVNATPICLSCEFVINNVLFLQVGPYLSFCL